MRISVTDNSQLGRAVILFPQASESKEIERAFDNDSLRGVYTIARALTEEVTVKKFIPEKFAKPAIDVEYERPQPKRSYKIKVRIFNRTKGKPLDFSE